MFQLNSWLIRGHPTSFCPLKMQQVLAWLLMDWFIRWPFLIEGFLFGIIGSFISVAVLKQIMYLLGARLMNKLPFFPFVFVGKLVTMMVWAILILGATMGVLGALVSVSRSIKQNV